MDTNGHKMPDPLPFAAWQSLSPARAAREVHARLAALPDRLCQAALAWAPTETALAADLARGSGPLRSLPVFVKDLFDVDGAPTKAGSTFLDRLRPVSGDATLVRRLRDLGAALAGKTHLVEFASGLTGENPHYGDCPHPRFPGRLTGGSSSGSAALVAAGVTPLALGTDTGGSVRIPAAFCGLHGFRLTPGDPFIRDAFPLAPTLDTAGWFTANAADLLTVTRALVPAAPDPGTAPRGCYLPARRVLPAIDPTVADACDRASAALAPAADATTAADLLASWTGAVDTYVTIGMSEAHAIHRDWLVPHRADYDPVIWQRFTDAGTWPAERLAAARTALTSVRAAWTAFLSAYDFLALPAAPSVAPTKAECTPDLRRAILTLTAPASLGGLPCLSLPVPLPSGLTAGLQVIVPRADSPVIDRLLAR